MHKTALVKISGDLLQFDSVLQWIKELTAEYFVVVCVGGGTQINKAFAKHGIPLVNHGPLGRETRSLRERQLARDVLEENRAVVQDLLASKKINVAVVIPVLEVGTVLCHVNGDVYVLTAYHGFDKIVVATTKERLAAKREHFAAYSKIEVVAMPPES